LCFLIACHFYGVGFNQDFLMLSLLGPLIVWISHARSGLTQLIASAPGTLLGSVAFLLIICMHHLLFSVSPDSSFAPSLILAALPLWVLVASLVNTQLLVRAMTLLIYLFALWSVCMFLAYGQRAYAPLPDPNNYVTLLYLAWIPWVLRRLSQPSGNVLGRNEHLWTFLVCWLVCLALYATESRFSLLVVSGLCVTTLYCVWRFGFSKKGCMVVWLAAIVAFLMYVGLGSTGTEVGIVEFVGTEAEGVRWHLLQSTWDAMLEFGGLNGTGLFTFSLFYPSVRSVAEQGTAGIFVHNDFVQLALEGGIWLVLPLLVLLGLVVVKVFRGLFLSRTWDSRVGYIIALAVALAHAAVNFVFYVLPILIVFGVWFAVALGVEKREAPASRQVSRRTVLTARCIWASLALVLSVNTLYLALDVISYGVFSAQLHVPYAKYIRENPERMLGFARFAQTVNGDRGIPVLAEAKILEFVVDGQPTVFGLEQARSTFQRAIDSDPWNPLTYTSYHEFLQRYPRQRSTHLLAEPTWLLRQALQLDPANLQAARLLLDYHIEAGNIAAASAVANDIFLWCDLLAKRHRNPLRSLLMHLESVRHQYPAMELSAELQACQSKAETRPGVSGQSPTWHMRWLRDQSRA
jgi:hypothetical protein